MEVAHRITQLRDDVHFVIAGNPKTHYGSEMISVKEESFKDHVLKQHPFDLSRFHFLDSISESSLRDLFRISTCHFYWTVPFTLSWSLFQAMSSGCLVLGSNTAPVRDVVFNNKTGVLVSPNDKDQMVEELLAIVRSPDEYLSIRENARLSMVKNYSLDVLTPARGVFYP